jgi:hypothetical protein
MRVAASLGRSPALLLPPSREYLAREVDNIVVACSRLRAGIQQGRTPDIFLEAIKEMNRSVFEPVKLPDEVKPGQARSHRVAVAWSPGASPEDCECVLARLCRENSIRLQDEERDRLYRFCRSWRGTGARDAQPSPALARVALESREGAATLRANATFITLNDLPQPGVPAPPPPFPFFERPSEAGGRVFDFTCRRICIKIAIFAEY